MRLSFSFYSPELEHVRTVRLSDVVRGLNECTQFKPLPLSQSGTYIMLTDIRVYDLAEALEIQHSYTGAGTKEEDNNFLLVEVDVDEKASPPQMRCVDIKNRAMVFQKSFWLEDLVELGKDMFLVDNLVVDHF